MEMQIVIIPTNAWEEWTIEVPDGTNPQDVADGKVDITEWLSLDEAGHDSAVIEFVAHGVDEYTPTPTTGASE